MAIANVGTISRRMPSGSVERYAPAHGFAPCIQASLSTLGALCIGGLRYWGPNYRKQEDVEHVSAVAPSPWVPLYWLPNIERLGLLAMGRNRGQGSRTRLGDELKSSSRHRNRSRSP